MEIEKHVDGDLPEDERVAAVSIGFRGIVCQQLRLDVALDESRTQERLSQPQKRHGRWGVELDAECRRREHHAAKWRSAVVHPRGGDHRPNAVGHHDHVLRADPVFARDVTDEGRGIFDERANAFSGTELAG